MNFVIWGLRHVAASENESERKGKPQKKMEIYSHVNFHTHSGKLGRRFDGGNGVVG